jgi:hypothetical protein
MVWSTSLHEHPDNNPEEAADLRQRAYSPWHELFLRGGQLVSERKVPRDEANWPAFAAGVLPVRFTA